jgi:hypothetical protein
MTPHIHYQLAHELGAEKRRAADAARLKSECAAPAPSRRPESRRDGGAAFWLLVTAARQRSR